METQYQYIQSAMVETDNFNLVRYLKALGYSHFDHMSSNGAKPYYEEEGDNEIFYSLPRYMGGPKYTNFNYQEGKPQLKGTIDCGKNENLFLDLICLRSDSDKWQRFILDCDCAVGEMREQHLPKGATIVCTYDKCPWPAVMRKMTPEELVKFHGTEQSVLIPSRMSILKSYDKQEILKQKYRLTEFNC